MKFLGWAVLIAPLLSARAVSSFSANSQQPLVPNTGSTVRDKVPGDNPAYFSRMNRTEQLFSVGEFTVSPYPVVSHHRTFFYLRGRLYNDEDLGGLADATLELHITPVDGDDDSGPYFHKKKLSEFGFFTVRFDEEKGRAYGGPLVKGRQNEMVGDFFMFNSGREHGTETWDIEVVAKMPDDRILFAFEGRVPYTY